MPATPTTPPPAKQNDKSEPANADLSTLLEQTLEKQPNEQIKSVRLFDNCYRCNWWLRVPSNKLDYSSGTISKSRFLRATMTDGKLLIDG